MYRLIALSIALMLLSACEPNPRVGDLDVVTPVPKPPTPTPNQFRNPKLNPDIDNIRGIASFSLGASRRDLESHLKPFSNPSLTSDVNLYKDIDNCTRYSSAQPGELDWVGVPVKEVRLQFEAGYVRVIDVGFEPEQFGLFTRAFEIKFGLPFSTIADVSEWKGNDTRISIFWGTDSVAVMSATSDRVCADAKAKQEQRKRDSLDGQARKAAERF